jgi:sugar/nucleoside kinase (ribokinase family)
MASRQAKTPSPTKPTVIGTGLLALDVVIADDESADPILCAGGTCGNVLTALAFLGWASYPIARLRSDAASQCVIEDLKSWGVKLDFVSLSDSGSTPVVVQLLVKNGKGERSHKFSRKCPACGAWLPWYKAVKAATVPELSSRLPNSNVFYFDRTSRGAVTLADNARRSGALVVFEPSAESDPSLLADALAAAHVVKVASDRLRGNSEVLKAKGPMLIIETLGSDGLRYARAAAGVRRQWKALPAFPVEEPRDSAGAGDWCTAGIISAIGTLSPEQLRELPERELRAAIRLGQAMAAWNCRYDGARGGMYVNSRAEFERAISAIVHGKRGSAKTEAQAKTRKGADPVWCDCCLANV